jgi:hypothetical protein
MTTGHRSADATHAALSGASIAAVNGPQDYRAAQQDLNEQRDLCASTLNQFASLGDMGSRSDLALVIVFLPSEHVQSFAQPPPAPRP